MTFLLLLGCCVASDPPSLTSPMSQRSSFNPISTQFQLNFNPISSQTQPKKSSPATFEALVVFVKTVVSCTRNADFEGSEEGSMQTCATTVFGKCLVSVWSVFGQCLVHFWCTFGPFLMRQWPPCGALWPTATKMSSQKKTPWCATTTKRGSERAALKIHVATCEGLVTFVKTNSVLAYTILRGGPPWLSGSTLHYEKV